MKIVRLFQVAVISNKIITIVTKLFLGATCLGLISACSSPAQQVAAPLTLAVPTELTPKTYTTPTGVTITPYDIEPIVRKSL